jgi:hypothetical protein
VRNDAFRTAGSKLLAAGLIAASTLLLSSCGGGGAASSPTQGGALSILPNPGTAYAGIPFTVTVAGGRAPYALGSSEPTIFPVPTIVNSSIFEVLPQQPGVVDTGLQDGEVPRRAVTLNARDSNGLVATTLLSVLQNFLTGYGVSYVSACPAAGAGGSAPQACPGRVSAIIMSPTFAGQRRGNALIRFERIRGNFGFTQCGSPPPANAALVNAITQNTDHQGIAQVCLFVPADSPTGINAYRIIDVATGVYTDQIFLVDASTPGAALVALPSTITFTGTNNRCGTGSADFLVLGGSPPYTATSTNGTVAVTPSSSTQPGRFTVTLAIQNAPCPAGVQILVTDSQGGRATVTVDSIQGAPGPALVVAPTSFTLACGQSGTAVVVGGSGTYSAFSSGNGVVASVSGNQVQLTRSTGQPPPANGALISSTVNITDGNAISTITVTSPTTCT